MPGRPTARRGVGRAGLRSTAERVTSTRSVETIGQLHSRKECLCGCSAGQAALATLQESPNCRYATYAMGTHREQRPVNLTRQSGRPRSNYQANRNNVPSQIRSWARRTSRCGSRSWTAAGRRDHSQRRTPGSQAFSPPRKISVVNPRPDVYPDPCTMESRVPEKGTGRSMYIRSRPSGPRADVWTASPKRARRSLEMVARSLTGRTRINGRLRRHCAFGDDSNGRQPGRRMTESERAVPTRNLPAGQL